MNILDPDLPIVTITIPSFNQGAFLEEAILSVLSQTYLNVELIVVDGGSTDNSVEIIRKYDKQISWWVSEADNGQSHAINKGFAKCSGDIMGWLNSDDVLVEDAITQAVSYLDGQEMAMLVGASIITDGPQTLSGRLDRRQPTFDEMIYDARTFPQPSVFWTRDLWEMTGPLDESLYFLMDFELWLRMRHLAQNVFFTDNVLAYERTHPAQKSQEKDRFSQFQKTRVEIVLHACRSRGQSLYSWLAIIWMRRFRTAIMKRKPSLIRGGPYHRLATKAVLGRTN